jgi:hypothetical protein
VREIREELREIKEELREIKDESHRERCSIEAKVDRLNDYCEWLGVRVYALLSRRSRPW